MRWSPVLAGLYVGIVAGVGAIIPPGYGSVGVAGATFAVAALFVPVRRRIQRVVDRRFNRARYDAARTIDTFASAIRNELSQTELRDRLVQTVQDAVSPDSASLWLVPAGPAS